MTLWKAAIVVLALLTALAVVTGPLSAPAGAQNYSITIDFVFQQSGEVFEDILVFGTFTVLLPPSTPDTIDVALIANDTGTSLEQLFISTAVAPNTEFPFSVGHVTLVKGAFTLIIRSQVLNAEIFRDEYPVPNYDVSVSISSTTGDVGTPFVVETLIDLGNMSLVASRFDIRYVLDGQVFTQSQTVFLIRSELFVLGMTSIPANVDRLQWRTTQTFTLDPGQHTLVVTVFDNALVEPTQPMGAEVHSVTFSITVSNALSDEIQALQESTESRLDTLEDKAGALDQRTASIESSAAIANVLAWLAVVAIGLSTLALLIQFGILKLGRFRRGPPEPQEPPEPPE